MPWKDEAPGAPGIPARWTSSAKSGVGTAIGMESRVWFTISHGILNEIYYPRVDYACTRDFGLIVTDPSTRFFSEEKRDATSEIRVIEDGVPGFEIVSTCEQGRYRIEKTIVADPHRDAVLQRIRFVPLQGALHHYRLYGLVAPHLVNAGANNTGWVDDWKGVPMVFARGRAATLALGCSAPLRARAVGYVGVSDGWRDLAEHYELRWLHDHAKRGNIALTAEVDLPACGGEFTFALGFGRRYEEAAHRVLASLNDGHETAIADYVEGWRGWQAGLKTLDRRHGSDNTYRVSTAVLRTHEASSFPGGIIASLSIPWGYSKGDDDLGGYHLVWPRDLVQTAGGLLAAGADAEAAQVIVYLEATQEPDGHWPQNCWLDGSTYWSGIQMDECAAPILLVDLARRQGAIDARRLRRYWRMVRAAAGYLVRIGPATEQDRWEENGGYSPYTLAVEIAALLAAADIAEAVGAEADAPYLRETADAWNEMVETWTFARDTPLSRELGISGYYVRISPPDGTDGTPAIDGSYNIKNRPWDISQRRASEVVSPDALALVRFGLRAADDPRILDTVKAIDAQVRVEFPQGPCWKRYNGDGYGEHEDGSAFDGNGIGRPWPLLTGERAHYELAAGRVEEAERLLATFEAFAGEGHLLPEQIWDADDLPERELHRGEPTGSAMPLVWAHSEHLKLLRSLADGRVFDMPPQTRQRYQVDGVRAAAALWPYHQRPRRMPVGRALRVVLPEAATVHWSTDGWRETYDIPTRDTGFGTHVADLDTAGLSEGGAVVLTLHWMSPERWEGADYTVDVVAAT